MKVRMLKRCVVGAPNVVGDVGEVHDLPVGDAMGLVQGGDAELVDDDEESKPKRRGRRSRGDDE